jgi:hypothetical protein
MTPIQTHEAELRTLMERAGLTVDDTPSDLQISATTDGHTLMLYQWPFTTNYQCTYRLTREQGGIAAASHPDPRIALRHCLEMAGLLVDRPPQTDEQLVAWLTERWREPETHRRTDDGKAPIPTGAMVWQEIRVSCDTIRTNDMRWYYTGSLLTARELGAILWCAERFPEVKP